MYPVQFGSWHPSPWPPISLIAAPGTQGKPTLYPRTGKQQFFTACSTDVPEPKYTEAGVLARGPTCICRPQQTAHPGRVLPGMTMPFRAIPGGGGHLGAFARAVFGAQALDDETGRAI